MLRLTRRGILQALLAAPIAAAAAPIVKAIAPPAPETVSDVFGHRVFFVENYVSTISAMYCIPPGFRKQPYRRDFSEGRTLPE